MSNEIRKRRVMVECTTYSSVLQGRVIYTVIGLIALIGETDIVPQAFQGFAMLPPTVKSKG